MQPDKLSELIDMVKEMAVKQHHLEEAVTSTTINATSKSVVAVRLDAGMYVIRVVNQDISPEIASTNRELQVQDRKIQIKV